MAEIRKSLGIQAIGWSVLVANLLLVFLDYLLPAVGGFDLPRRLAGFLSIVAAFPLDFYQAYLGEDVLAHFVWITTVIACSIGIIIRNKLARTVFLLLNVIHMVVLSVIVLSKYGQGNFLDYFFKLYFSLVASGTYVGFLTLPEIRAIFKIEREESKLMEWVMLWLNRPVIPDSIPKDAFGHYNLGLAYRRLERFDEALKHLKKAVQQKPEQAEFHFALGMTYAARNKDTEAIACLKEAVRLDPIHPQAAVQLGLLYQGQGCAQEAMENFQKAVHADPQDAKNYLYLGQEADACGRREQALEAFQKAVELKADAQGYYHLGRVYAQRFEKYKEAREAFRAAVRLQEDFPQAHFELGMTCLKLEIPKEAVRAFRDVLRFDEENKQAHYQLGFSYAILQDFDSARREYRYLKEVDEDLANNLKMMLK